MNDRRTGDDRDRAILDLLERGALMGDESLLSMLEAIAPGIREDLAELRAACQGMAAALEPSVASGKVTREQANALIAESFRRALDAWMRETFGPLPEGVRIPTALLMGTTAIAPLFAKRRRSARIETRGLQRRILVYRDGHRAQLDLPLPEAGKESGKGLDVLEVVARVLGHRELRAFTGCMVLAARAERSGASSGRRFLYAPAALASVLGMPRRGTRGDFAPKVVASVRESFAALASVRVRTELRGPGGEAVRFDEPLIAHESGVSVQVVAPGRPGRPRLEAWMLADPIVKAARAQFTWLPDSAVAAPAHVDARTWDKAFALLLRLAAYGSGEASPVALVASLCDDCGVLPRELPGLLELLRREHLVTGKMTGPRVRFELGAALRFRLPGAGPSRKPGG